MQGYCNADTAGDFNGYKSSNGHIFAVASGAVSWYSRLQKIVALSSVESEYVSAGSNEALWMTRLAKDLGMFISIPLLGDDSKSAVYLAKNAIFHSHTEHMDVWYHFIR